MIDGLEHAVSRKDYIAGGGISPADVYVGGQIGYGIRFGMIDARPAFAEYWERLADRSAHKRATALDAVALPDPA